MIFGSVGEPVHPMDAAAGRLASGERLAANPAREAQAPMLADAVTESAAPALLTSLPPDVVGNIAEYLSLRDLRVLRTLNKQFRDNPTIDAKSFEFRALTLRRIRLPQKRRAAFAALQTKTHAIPSNLRHHGLIPLARNAGNVLPSAHVPNALREIFSELSNLPSEKRVSVVKAADAAVNHMFRQEPRVPIPVLSASVKEMFTTILAALAHIPAADKPAVIRHMMLTEPVRAASPQVRSGAVNLLLTSLRDFDVHERGSALVDVAALSIPAHNHEGALAAPTIDVILDQLPGLQPTHKAAIIASGARYLAHVPADRKLAIADRLMRETRQLAGHEKSAAIAGFAPHVNRGILSELRAMAFELPASDHGPILASADAFMASLDTTEMTDVYDRFAQSLDDIDASEKAASIVGLAAALRLIPSETPERYIQLVGHVANIPEVNMTRAIRSLSSMKQWFSGRPLDEATRISLQPTFRSLLAVVERHAYRWGDEHRAQDLCNLTDSTRLLPHESLTSNLRAILRACETLNDESARASVILRVLHQATTPFDERMAEIAGDLIASMQPLARGRHSAPLYQFMVNIYPKLPHAQQTELRPSVVDMMLESGDIKTSQILYAFGQFAKTHADVEAVIRAFDGKVDATRVHTKKMLSDLQFKYTEIRSYARRRRTFF